MFNLKQIFRIRQSLRIKTLLIIFVLLTILFFLFQIIATSYIQKGYAQLEQKDAHDDIGRALESIKTEVDSLDSKAGDWANWDDAYNFVKARKLNTEFISTNMGDTSYQQIGINIILFASNSGKIIYGKAYDLNNLKDIPVPVWWQNNLSPLSPLLQKNPDSNLSGFIIEGDKPMLIAARPVLTSNGDGPVLGTIIFGRYLDSIKINEIAKTQKYSLSVKNFNAANLPPDFQNARAQFSAANQVWTNPKDSDTIYAYAWLKDAFGKPALILQEKLDRDVYNFGLESTRIFTLIFIGFCIILLIVIMLILEKEVLSRLSRLRGEVKNIGQQGKLSSRVSDFGTDELGDLARNINESMQNLETVSKKVAYEESQKESILDTIGEGVVVTDENNRITFVNPAFHKLIGCSSEDLNGKSFSEAFRAFDLKENPLPADYLDDKNSAVAKSSEIKVLLGCKDKKIPVIINMTPINVNKVYKGVVRVFYDYSVELEVQKQKDDFFSIASHELRTPLTVISGNTDNILQGFGNSKLSDIDLQQLKDVEVSADRLITMVNDFLNVSRLDQGRVLLDLKPVNICALVEKIKEEMVPLFKEKGLDFQIECEKDHGLVMADEIKLREIIVNIIGNSLKFTKKGGICSVSHIIKNETIVTEISDTGIGISPDKQHLLFNRFQQAMDRTLAREAGGTGLGLYISREFARLMGGDMWLVKSVPGEGSTFAFSLLLTKKEELLTGQSN